MSPDGIKKLAKGGISEYSTEKLLTWIFSKDQPPAVSYFTSSPERTIAAEFEYQNKKHYIDGSNAAHKAQESSEDSPF